MNKHRTAMLLATMLLPMAGCDVFDSSNGGGNSSAPAPGLATYNVTVSSVDMENKDSGAPLVIEGFPIDGGVLTIDP